MEYWQRTNLDLHWSNDWLCSELMYEGRCWNFGQEQWRGQRFQHDHHCGNFEGQSV